MRFVPRGGKISGIGSSRGDGGVSFRWIWASGAKSSCDSLACGGGLGLMFEETSGSWRPADGKSARTILIATKAKTKTPTAAIRIGKEKPEAGSVPPTVE